jgi:hypothetical protein
MRDAEADYEDARIIQAMSTVGTTQEKLARQVMFWTAESKVIDDRWSDESIRLKRRVEDLEAFMRTRVKDECDCWHCRGFRAALSPQEKP